MSERFDDLLSGAVDSASSAAHEPGADAARKRGRQRRNRQRLAASTLSLALLGVVGGVAAVTIHGSNAVPAASVSATASASPTGSASPLPAVTPWPTASGGPSSPSADPSTTTTTAAASPSVTASPGAYVASAWLAPQQMPFSQAGVTQWAYNSFNYGSHLGGHVYELGTDGGWVIGCSEDMGGHNLTSLAAGLVGAQYQAFTGASSDKILPNGAIPAYTDQAAYFYHDAAQAEAAMNGLTGDFARCKASLTGVDATTGSSLVGETQQTTGTQDAQCWTVLARNAKSTGGETIHDCFVRSGNVVEEVHVVIHEVATFDDENFPAFDTTLIPELQHDLVAYSN
jgi:hypothetical protein